jgi:hypothetical protein
LRIHVAERDAQCPLVEKVEDRVRSLEDTRTAQTAAEKTDHKWMRWLWPFVWAAGGIFGLLVLQNAKFILRAFIH